MTTRRCAALPWCNTAHAPQGTPDHKHRWVEPRGGRHAMRVHSAIFTPRSDDTEVMVRVEFGSDMGMRSWHVLSAADLRLLVTDLHDVLLYAEDEVALRNPATQSLEPALTRGGRQ